MVKLDAILNKEGIQKKEYEFPYHYLLCYDENKIDIVKSYSFGFEHFSLIYIIKKILIQKKPNNILDIGCGDGKLINELLKEKLIQNNTNEVIGIDNNNRALAFARIFNDYNKAKFIQEDIFNYKAKSYDIIILMEVLEHIPTHKLNRLIKVISSLLSSNKYLIISVPSINIPLQSKHYKHYDLNSLKTLLYKDFKIEDVFYIGSVGIIYKLFKSLYMFFDFLKVEKIKIILFSFYKRKFLLTSEQNCLHILILCKKK